MDAQAQILVVDDDRGIRSLLAEYLETNGFRCLLAADGAGMGRALETSRPDLVVLDLNLPGEDGLSLCRRLRTRSRLPVIMLTARDSAADRILGLETGADDYLSKPFEPRELLARIRSVLRRIHALPPGVAQDKGVRMRFADWILDVRARHLLDSRGVVISLSMTEFRLLKAFLELPNRILSRDQLLSLSGSRESVSVDRSIDLLVSRLRNKLGDTTPKVIQTVRHEGYLMAAAVTVEEWSEA